MNNNYRLLLEDFISYFKKGTCIGEFPEKITILGNFYRNCEANSNYGYDYERFEYPRNEKEDSENICRNILVEILKETFDEGFQYYPEGDEYGNFPHHIKLETLDEIKDPALKDRILEDQTLREIVSNAERGSTPELN